MPEPVIRTHLELDGPSELRPAGPARLAGVEVRRMRPPDGAVNRWFYVEVGGPHAWVDHLQRSEAEWQAWAETVETWVATVQGRRAGYYELRPGRDAVELAYFGLLAAHQGDGLGGALLTHAARRALALGSRVTVHTCTLDGPHALANYVARGFRRVRSEQIASP